MGDNLKAASRFVSQSISSLDHITTASQLPQDRVLDTLANVQRGAKAMRARAIYRAAQTAVDIVQKGKGEDKLQSELNVVRSLVVQYQTGLEEILGSQKDTPPMSRAAAMPLPHAVIDFPAAEASTTDIAPVQLSAQPSAALQEPSLLDDMMMPLSDADNAVPAEASKAAKPEPIFEDNLLNQMTPLVQFAPDAEQREALCRLSRLHEEHMNCRPSAGQNLGPDAPLSLDTKPKQVKRAKMLAFETLMPELTNVVLTTARHMEKTVSISYAAQGVELHADLTDKLRKALSDLSVVLVTRSLEKPEIRRARDESGAGHISIMAAVTSGLLELTVECTGRDISPSDLEMPSWNALKDMGAALNFNREASRFCLSVAGLRAKLFTPSQKAVVPELEQAS